MTDYKNLGLLTLEGVIKNSSNVGASDNRKKTKKQKIYKTLNKFNFGGDLYVDFPSIQNGNIKDISSWDDALHGTVGYGYGYLQHFFTLLMHIILLQMME